MPAMLPRPAPNQPPRPAPARTPVPRPEVRHAVKKLLTRSQAFNALDPGLRQQIARDMAQIGDYLVAPEGIPANTLRPQPEPFAEAQAGPLIAAGTDPSASTYDRDAAQVNRIGDSGFQASGAREGAEVAGVLLRQVNFPTFVASLIEGVFHAIVKANIEQMEAYGKLVSSVAMTLNEFRDHNTTDNQGRDHLVEQFPDLFALDTSSDQPRLSLRDGVDEDRALQRVNAELPIEGGRLDSLDLEDDEVEGKLTRAARTHLATGRQQLLATMVLMGISRIVVTDGRLSAKIMYDFQARDTMRRQRSAAAFDYARNRWGNVQRTTSGEGKFEATSEGETRSSGGDYRGANYYAKGEYKYDQQPIMTAMSAASEASDAALQTRAQLAGNVEINFKSDYLPLEQMVTPEQIAQLQLASQPTPGAAAGAPAGQPSQAPPAAPPGGPAPAPPASRP
jgi:hypothetical protein